MKLSQFEALLEEAAHAEGERQAGMIIAVNLGSHGKKEQIERTVRQLTQRNAKSLSLDDAVKMGKAKP